MTFIGTIPRAFILAWIGSSILQYKPQFWIVLGVLAVLGILGWFAKKKLETGKKPR